MLVVTTRPPLPSLRARRLFAETTADAEWRRIHGVADLVAPILERVILSSFEDALADVDERALVRAIRARDVDAALGAIPYATLESRLLRMVDVLRAGYLGGAHVAGQGLDLLPPEAKRAAESDPYIAVMSMLGPKIKGYFDLLNPMALEWAETESTKLIKDDISEASKAQIRALLVEEFQEGYGPAALARKILPLVPLTNTLAAAADNYYNGLKKRQTKGDKSLTDEKIDRLFANYALRLRRYRARAIARTETIAASNAGQAAMWQLAADQGYLDRSKTMRRWIVTPDDRLCPTCKQMKGQEVPVDKPFKAPGGYEVANPPLHPQCLPGDARVTAKGIAAASKRWYEGDLIVISTSGGKTLSCTPNHPILTPSGWVAACLLKKGDYVVCRLRHEGTPGMDGDDQEMPAPIEDIAHAFGCAEHVSAMPVPVATEDFHGDGKGSQVAVVWTDGLLMNDVDATFPKKSGEQVFRWGDVESSRLDGLGMSHLGFERLGLATRSCVGGGNLARPLVGAHSRPLNRLGIGLPARLNPKSKQASADTTPVNTEALGQRLLRDAVEVQATQLGQIDVQPGVADRTRLNVALPKYPADDGLAYAEFLGDARSSPAGQVLADDIVAVDIVPFRGHVYNLQTASGWYIAEGIITHNCRCGQGLVNPTAPSLPKQETPPLPPKALPGSPEWIQDLTEIAMSLGGIHEKHVYRDKEGAKWLFKPDEVAGLAERATYKIMAELGLPAPEVYLVTIGGKTGTIQRMFNDVDAPLKADGLHTLTRQQLEDIQTHQVLDWLVGQHDSNEGAFLISKAGRIYAVDKGQAVKWIGSDTLDWTYNPNPLPVVYNRMFEAHIAGRITLDRSAIAPILKRVVDLDDRVLRDAFRPYAEYGVRKGYYRTVDELLDRLVQRKRTIVSDFDDLYKRADAARARRLGQQTPVGAYTRLDDDFARQVTEQGWAGRSIMVGGPDFEDAHVLAYEIRQGTKITLVLEAKVREAAEGRILQAIGTPSAAGPRTHPADNLWGDVLTTIKHVHYHLKPGSPGKDDVLKAGKVAGIQKAAEKIVKTSSPSAPQDVEDMLGHYSALIEKMTGKTVLDVATASVAQVESWLKAAYDPNLFAEQYQIPVKPAPIAPDKIHASRERPWQYKRTLQNGEIVASAAKEILSGETGYTLDLGGGMTGIYIQHGDANTYSKMGRLTIYREGYQGTAREIADTLDQFKRLGVEAKLATRADLELVYLHKQAHAMKLEGDAAWNSAIAAAEAEPTVAGKLTVLKEALKKKLKLKKADKLEDLPGYNPEPKFDRGWNPASGATATGPAGRPYWERFDIDRSTFETEMADYALAHHLWSRDTYTFLRDVLEGNGWALNTEERIRTGVYTGQGMSPEPDMRTGGASYFFTRIMPKRAWDSYHLVFDQRLLLRTDLISYDGDMYGRSDPATKTRRNVTIAAWKNASRHGANEAIIKNGVSLVDNLIRINSGGRRREILDLFRQHGITEINGRQVEDVVR